MIILSYCQGDPARQESIVSQLHLAELAAGLCGLKSGGSLVIKMFTFFQSASGMANRTPQFLFFLIDESITMTLGFSDGDGTLLKTE